MRVYRLAMSTFTIGEVAERSGFTASALRYYEDIGLISPSARTPAGYRLFDEHALARLSFIAGAKHLGCSLDEITDLLTIWDGDSCEPVQHRLHDLLSEKIVSARRQSAELGLFTARLEARAHQLVGSASDGPCGDSCACVTAPVARQDDPATGEPDLACTLDGDALPGRLSAWDSLLDQAGRRMSLPDGGLRLQFNEGVPVEALARITSAERQCCAFFSFSITLDGRGIGLEIRAPDGAQELVASLFGEADTV